MTLRLVDRRFPVDPGGLLPPVTDDNRFFHEALARGELAFQCCSDCARLRFPIAPVCPYCGGTGWHEKLHGGSGTVFSWVRYHKSYLPEFADLMPYVVLTVQLEHGPRLIGRLLHRAVDIRSGAPVRTVLERWSPDRFVPAFELA